MRSVKPALNGDSNVFPSLSNQLQSRLKVLYDAKYLKVDIRVMWGYTGFRVDTNIPA